MFGLVLYFIVLLLLFLRYRRRFTVAKWLLLLYLLSSVISIIKFFYRPSEFPIDTGSILFYIICVLALLVPFLSKGVLDCRCFSFPKQYVKVLSIILIIFGFINLYFNIPRLFTISTLVNNMADIRQAYYRGDSIEYNESFIELLSNWVCYIQFLSPILALYYLLQKKGTMAFLLVVASASWPVGEMLIGEREASLVYVSNFVFSFIFFRPYLDKELVSRIKKLSFIAVIPFLAFIALMTVSRFGESDRGVLGSLCDYSGAQPFSFSYAASSINIDAQALGGRLCFPFLFPQSQRLSSVINDYINSPMDLNTFMGFPGSLLLDFGHKVIVVIVLISLLFLFLIQFGRRGRLYSFYSLFAMLVLYQILFMGLFYFEPVSKYHIIMYSLVYLSAMFFGRSSYMKQSRLLV